MSEELLNLSGSGQGALLTETMVDGAVKILSSDCVLEGAALIGLTRWSDRLFKVAGRRWMLAAHDKSRWRNLVKAYGLLNYLSGAVVAYGTAVLEVLGLNPDTTQLFVWFAYICFGVWMFSVYNMSLYKKKDL